MVVYATTPALQRMREEALCEFRVNLGYTVSPNPVSGEANKALADKPDGLSFGLQDPRGGKSELTPGGCPLSSA